VAHPGMNVLVELYTFYYDKNTVLSENGSLENGIEKVVID